MVTNHPRRRLLTVLLVLFGLVIIGCAGKTGIVPPPPPPEPAPPPAPAISPASPVVLGYSVNPGDLLEISVFGENDLSKTVRVGEDGSFSYPLLGKIKAEGLTPEQLELELAGLLQDYLVDPQVTIFIREYSKISVLGQVKKPGTYELRGRMTVTQAIALAGGFTEIARMNGTWVVRTERGKEEIIPVPVGKILDKGDRTLDVYLKPNDIVFVPESFL